MQKNKVLTFAALGVALVALIKASESNPELKKELEAFKLDFDNLGAQPAPISPELNEARLSLVEASNVIVDLKKQLDEALEVKETKTEQLIVTVDKVKYVVNHGAHPHSAKVIAESPEIAKAILKIVGQNAISKL